MSAVEGFCNQNASLYHQLLGGVFFCAFGLTAFKGLGFEDGQDFVEVRLVNREGFYSLLSIKKGGSQAWSALMLQMRSEDNGM
jgi:hypothetical protein